MKVTISAVAWILLIANLCEKSKRSPVTFRGRYFNCFEIRMNEKNTSSPWITKSSVSYNPCSIISSP